MQIVDRFWVLMSFLFFLGFASLTFADDQQNKIQMHEHMAGLHTKAADCLRAGKKEKECHEAMTKECKDMKPEMNHEMNCDMMGDSKKSQKPEKLNLQNKNRQKPDFEDESDLHETK